MLSQKFFVTFLRCKSISFFSSDAEDTAAKPFFSFKLNFSLQIVKIHATDIDFNGKLLWAIIIAIIMLISRLKEQKNRFLNFFIKNHDSEL